MTDDALETARLLALAAAGPFPCLACDGREVGAGRCARAGGAVIDPDGPTLDPDRLAPQIGRYDVVEASTLFEPPLARVRAKWANDSPWIPRVAPTWCPRLPESLRDPRPVGQALKALGPEVADLQLTVSGAPIPGFHYHHVHTQKVLPK